MTTQDTLMTRCPATGDAKPYPSHAGQWRRHHGSTAWLFNPWSGTRRNALDVGSDPFGLAIYVAGEPVRPADQDRLLAGTQVQANRAELLAEDIECLHKCLDEAGVRRADEGGAMLSMWGRVLRFHR